MTWLRKSFVNILVIVATIGVASFGTLQVGAKAALQISSAKVYVLNNVGNSITVYALFRAGNVAPVRVIAGAKTRLFRPRAFAMDRTGRLFVVNGGGNEILVFAARDHGNVAPKAIIGGTNTQLNRPISIAIDAIGNVLVLGSDRSIETFDPKSTGDNRPLATARGFLPAGSSATSIGADSLGRIFLSDPAKSSVYVYGESQRGSTVLEKTISGASSQINDPVGLAVDSIGRLYISETNESVLLIPNYDRGDVAPTVNLHGSSTKISGAGVSGFDAGACIYTPNFQGNSITVFDPGTTGNAAPNAIYQGSRTQLDGPVAVLLY